jgi:alanyl-tRNA synthetase
VAYAGPYDDVAALKGAARDVRGALGSGVIALALDGPEPQLFVTVSDDLVDRGLSAGALVSAAAPAIDGKGGGRPGMAQGKGSRREGVDDALVAVREAVAEAIG